MVFISIWYDCILYKILRITLQEEVIDVPNLTNIRCIYCTIVKFKGQCKIIDIERICSISSPLSVDKTARYSLYPVSLWYSVTCRAEAESVLLGRQLDDFNGIISIDTNDNLALECHLNVASNCSSQFIGQFTARVAVSSLRLSSSSSSSYLQSQHFECFVNQQ